MVKKRNYCNNADLTAALVVWQKACKEHIKAKVQIPTIPNYVGECILQICNRLTRGFNFDFTAHTYRDEMVADAIERCIYACSKFNAEKSSSGAFNYLTTVAINAMKKRINDERKHNYTKHKHFQSQYLLGDFEGLAPNEHSDKVISDFEERAKNKILTSSAKPSKVKKKVAKKKKQLKKKKKKKSIKK